MQWFQAQPLRRQLFVAICLLLVPVLALAVWSGVATLREREADLGAQARIIALTTATYVNSVLLSQDDVAHDVATRADILSLDPVVVTDLLRSTKAQRPWLSDAVLAIRGGQVVARAGAAPLPPEWPQLVSQVLDSRSRVASRMQVSDGGFYIGFGYPVLNDSGQPIGVLWFINNLQAVQEALTSLPLPPGSVINIVDSDGRILMRSLEPERYVGQMLRRGEPVPGTTEADGYVGGDGIPRVYGDAPIERGAWRVSVGIPRSVAINNASTLWTRGVAILVLGVIGGLVIALLVSGRLISSVGHLRAAAQRIASGDFAPMPRQAMPSREFIELQDAFGQMLQRFNETRAELDRHLGVERQTREELLSLQSQVIRQERLAAVGQLVSGVAHEINNPLQAILGFAELLQLQPDAPESVKADLRLIQKESARACGIIRNLAMFARQQPGEAEPVRLADVITAVAELRQRRLESEDIELRIEDGAKQIVSAVITELQQVVLNFVVNAEQSIVMSGRLPGRITIRTFDRDHYAVLEVEDTGPGIPPDDEAKLFQPFFTTKPVGQGTGLGLSVSYGIIDSLGGRIGHRAAPAGGAIFYFELPVDSFGRG